MDERIGATEDKVNMHAKRIGIMVDGEFGGTQIELICFVMKLYKSFAWPLAVLLGRFAL